MMEAIEARGRASGEARAREAAALLATRIGQAVPGVRVEAIDGGVAITGRGLARRMIADPMLRWIGGMLR